MCLDQLANKSQIKYFKPIRRGGHNVGAKVFFQTERGLFSFYCTAPRPFPRGVWLREEDWRRNSKASKILHSDASHSSTYKTGFHIYHDPEFLTGTSTKVYYRRVVAKGYEDGMRVIVAKEIFIPK